MGGAATTAAAAPAPSTGRSSSRHQRQRLGLVLLVVLGAVAVPGALGFLVPSPPSVSSSPTAPAAVSLHRSPFSTGSGSSSTTTALYVKREGRRGPGYKGGGDSSRSGSGGGGGRGSDRGRPGGRGRRGEAGAEPSKDPNKRLANLNRKLTSIIEVGGCCGRKWVRFDSIRFGRLGQSNSIGSIGDCLVSSLRLIHHQPPTHEHVTVGGHPLGGAQRGAAAEVGAQGGGPGGDFAPDQARAPAGLCVSPSGY